MTHATVTADIDLQREANWRFSALVWSVVGLGLLLLFWQTAWSMVFVWWRSATFNHGFLIPLIVGWLVWNRRSYLLQVLPRPSPWGLAGMVAAGLVWVAGWAGDVQVVQQFALIFMLQTSVIAVLGLTVARILLFPLFYLIFCVPFGEELVAPMQDFTAAFVVKGIELFGIPVFSDGVFISIPTGNFEVAEACSGVRFMIAMLALGVLFANLSFESWRRRLMVLLFVIIVPVIANGFRAFGIVMIAHLSKMEYATGVDHLIYGWFFFAAVMLILIVIGLRFSDRKPTDPLMDVGSFRPLPGWRPTRKNIQTAGGLVLLIAVLAAAYAGLMDSRTPDISVTNISLPMPQGEWREAAPPQRAWKPEFRNIDAEAIVSYSNGADTVSVYTGLYHYQRPGAEVVQFGNYMDTPEPWGTAARRFRSITIGDDRYTVLESDLSAGPYERTVWSIYWVDGALTANRYGAKALAARSRLFAGNQTAGVIAVSVEDGLSTRPSGQILAEFLEQWASLDKVMSEIADGGLQGQSSVHQ